jgi:hypothetical protein
MARSGGSDIAGSVADAVNPVNKHAFHDGHKVNESYKMPVANPKLSENLSYMHPHGSPHDLEKPWQTVDKTLAEAQRHPEQLSSTKTVFPTDTGKQRGAPRPGAGLKNLNTGKPRII